MTDTNRRQAEQFGTVGDNFGYTETAGEKAARARQPRRPTARCSRRRPVTPARRSPQQLGVKSVQASSYGNPITYAPENRPDQAMDGNLRTAWSVAAFDNPVGPVPADHPGPPAHHRPRQPRPAPVRAAQPLDHTRHACASTAAIPSPSTLGASSRTAAGQTVTFPTRTFTTLQITIDATNTGDPEVLRRAVGRRVRRGPPHRANRSTRSCACPRTSSTRPGTASAVAPADARHDPRDRPPRCRPQPIPRSTSPGPSRFPRLARFSVSGTAELSALVPDDVLDRLLGTTVPGIVAAYSSGRLPGDVSGPHVVDARRRPGHGVESRARAPGGELARVRLGASDHLRPPVDGDGDRRAALGAHVHHRQRRWTEPHRGPATPRRQEPGRGRPRQWRCRSLLSPVPTCGSPSTLCVR